jgi:predicted hotdog family 3-hydroxylacyl-ACP dehydratase
MDDLTLPLPAEALIPHRLPMRLVDRLTACDPGAGSGTVVALPSEESLLLTREGRLDPLALFEMIAQAYAAVKGYENLINGRPVRGGYLVGIRRGRVQGSAFPGDRLAISVETEMTLGDFSVARGTVSREGRSMASAVIKVWSPP